MERENSLIKYSVNIVIANDSSMKILKKINILDYLILLFKQVYITETIRKKCKFKIPPWMVIGEPSKELKNIISDFDIDKGEISAVGLVIELEILQKYNSLKNNQYLLFVDKKVKKTKITNEYTIECIDLCDIFSLAYSRKLFTKEEGMEIINKMKKLGKVFSKKDINYIFNEETNKKINN
jgi:predicted nucleic acid-binding protein